MLLVHDVTQTQRKAIYSPVELCSSISSHLFRWKKSARAPFGRLTSPYIYRKLLLNAVYSHTDCTPHHTPPFCTSQGVCGTKARHKGAAGRKKKKKKSNDLALRDTGYLRVTANSTVDAKKIFFLSFSSYGSDVFKNLALRSRYKVREQKLFLRERTTWLSPIVNDCRTRRELRGSCQPEAEKRYAAGSVEH